MIHNRPSDAHLTEHDAQLVYKGKAGVLERILANLVFAFKAMPRAKIVETDSYIDERMRHMRECKPCRDQYLETYELL